MDESKDTAELANKIQSDNQISDCTKLIELIIDKKDLCQKYLPIISKCITEENIFYPMIIYFLCKTGKAEKAIELCKKSDFPPSYNIFNQIELVVDNDFEGKEHVMELFIKEFEWFTYTKKMIKNLIDTKKASPEQLKEKIPSLMAGVKDPLILLENFYINGIIQFSDILPYCKMHDEKYLPWKGNQVRNLLYYLNYVYKQDDPDAVNLIMKAIRNDSDVNVIAGMEEVKYLCEHGKKDFCKELLPAACETKENNYYTECQNWMKNNNY